MPIYAYRCSTCGHAQDVLQKLSDPLLTRCPACGAETFVKQVTAAGFQLKGSGWYVTDFRGGGGAKPEADKPAEASGGNAQEKSADKPPEKAADKPTGAGAAPASAPAEPAKAAASPAPAASPPASASSGG